MIMFLNKSKFIYNLCGKLSLRESGVVISECKLCISNDTGLKHLAASVRTPTIEISRFPISGDKNHSQSPYRFKAWGPNNLVIQPKNSIPPCGDDCFFNLPHCIDEISVELVTKSVKLIL